MFRPVIISAPFGNYDRLLRFNNVTYTVGTFTAKKRSWRDPPYGSKWFRVLTTVRYSIVNRSWINKLGLKNPGIEWYLERVRAGNADASDKIISVYGFNAEEWEKLFRIVGRIQPLAMEINASCPNVTKLPFGREIFQLAVDTKVPVIVKIPPVFYQSIVAEAYAVGIRYFHACNTLPTVRGGIGGKPLLTISKGVVSDIRRQYKDSVVIGGGGITSMDDVYGYMEAGASHVAVASMLLNPFNFRKVPKFVDSVNSARDLLVALG